MTGLFDTLSTAYTGLAASQLGSQVTGHNIANAATPGYNRQDLILTPVPGARGVNADVQRVSDALLAGQIWQEAASLGYHDTRASELERIERALGPIDENSLSSALDQFFASWRELTAAPASTAARAQTLARAESLASRVQAAAADLAASQADADTQVVSLVATSNALSDQVADLNRSIAYAETHGETTYELRDQRDRAVAELAEILGATSFEDNDGHANVTIAGGVALVQGATARHLETTPDATTGLAHVRLSGSAAGNLDARITSGRMGALLDTRDNELVQRIGALDTWAFDLATAVNGQHQLGVGLDGVSGRDLFVPLAAVAGAAENLAVAGLTGDQLGVALDAASLPGDSRGAEAIVALEGALVSGGKTLAGALGDLITAAGEASRSASQNREIADFRASELENLRQARSGVSIEEQMVMLTKYQRAFQAASRVIQTVDSMLQDLLSM
jgi:flagellar hook-associated protein 1 FlgK